MPGLQHFQQYKLVLEFGRRFVMDCLFCKIVSGQIPAKLVHQGDSVIAFDDINPQAPTHVLIIPKKHFENVGELAANDPLALKELFIAAKEIAASRALAGYRTVFNTGAEAGQSVFHAHLHLIGGRALQWPPG
jgi:histidine triad (HIT) family protein